MTSTPTSTNDWRSLYPFESHWFERGDGRIHFIDEGPQTSASFDAPQALLFVHGNPTWSFHWRRLISALRDRYRCIAPDHLGCGLSDKPQRLMQLNEHIENLVALVRTLNLERITLVAQDWGGAIGLGAMLQMPERLQQIILFNTGAFPPVYIPWRIRACRLPVLGRLAVQGLNLFSMAALRMTLTRTRKLAPAVAAGYLTPYDSWANRMAVYGFVHDIPAPRGRVSPRRDFKSPRDSPTCRDAAATLAQIEQELPSLSDRPSCLIWGMRDWCFRPDCLDRFQAAWPNAEVHRLSDVGHWVVEDAPDESLTIVEQFLASQLNQPTAAAT